MNVHPPRSPFQPLASSNDAIFSSRKRMKYTKSDVQRTQTTPARSRLLSYDANVDVGEGQGEGGRNVDGNSERQPQHELQMPRSSYCVTHSSNDTMFLSRKRKQHSIARNEPVPIPQAQRQAQHQIQKHPSSNMALTNKEEDSEHDDELHAYESKHSNHLLPKFPRLMKACPVISGSGDSRVTQRRNCMSMNKTPNCSFSTRSTTLTPVRCVKAVTFGSITIYEYENDLASSIHTGAPNKTTSLHHSNERASSQPTNITTKTVDEYEAARLLVPRRHHSQLLRKGKMQRRRRLHKAYIAMLQNKLRIEQELRYLNHMRQVQEAKRFVAAKIMSQSSLSA